MTAIIVNNHELANAVFEHNTKRGEVQLPIPPVTPPEVWENKT